MPYLRLTPEELASRKRRNLWIAAALVGFIVLLFATTFLRMQQNLADRRELEQTRIASSEAPERVAR